MNKVLYFTATWCAPCRAMKPVFEECIKDFDIESNYVDIEEYPDMVSKYNIRSVPTIIVLNNDEVLETLNGVMPKNKLLEVLKKY